MFLVQAGTAVLDALVSGERRHNVVREPMRGVAQVTYDYLRNQRRSLFKENRSKA